MREISKTQKRADILREKYVEFDARNKLSNREVIKYYGGKKNGTNAR
jgi:hypothetical protein